MNSSDVRMSMEFQDKKSFVGTIFYIAPEMLVDQKVDYGADLWALGIIIYKLFTGQYLFNEQNDYMIFEKIKNGKCEFDKSLPNEAKNLLINLLKNDPKERLGNGEPDSGREFNDLKSHPFFAGVDWAKPKNLIDLLGLEHLQNQENEISSEEEQEQEK